jgi:hypothetical protein
MSVLLNLIYTFNSIPVKIPAHYFVDTDKTNSRVYMERQKASNNEHNTAGEK